MIALIIDAHPFSRTCEHRRLAFQFLGKTSYILEFRSTEPSSLDDEPTGRSLSQRSNEPSLHDVKATRLERPSCERRRTGETVIFGRGGEGVRREAPHSRNGGARRDRTDDLMLAKHALSQLSYGPMRVLARIMVGPERFELSTSRLSSARSNQLSYGPMPLQPPKRLVAGPRSWKLVRRRKRNEDGGSRAL